MTAQRVVVPGSRRHGVNVYRYLHEYTWTGRVPDAFLPEANPGELAVQWIDIPPGGNRVVSYLDVVAPEELPKLELSRLLGQLKYRLAAVGNPTTTYWDPIWVRFRCSAPIPWSTELGALAGHMILCLQGERPAFVRL